MTNKELEELVRMISLQCFNKSFRHKAVFNHRLRTTGGRYHLKSHHLDFNPEILDVFGLDTLIKIIKHELCHYHLHLEGKGYQHRDGEFKALLNEVGGLRYTPSIESKQNVILRWTYCCVKCKQVYYRKRRFNENKFVCGHCSGKLKLLGRKEVKAK